MLEEAKARSTIYLLKDSARGLVMKDHETLLPMEDCFEIMREV